MLGLLAKESRHGYDNLIKSFPGQDQTNFEVVVHYPQGSPLTPERVGDQYDLSQRLTAIPGVIRVDSIYSGNPSLGRADYQRLYGGGTTSQLASEARLALGQAVGRDVVLMSAVSNQPPMPHAMPKLRVSSVGPRSKPP